eukprot:2551381-Rhodomonas_salina.1
MARGVARAGAGAVRLGEKTQRCGFATLLGCWGIGKIYRARGCARDCAMGSLQGPGEVTKGRGKDHSLGRGLRGLPAGRWPGGRAGDFTLMGPRWPVFRPPPAASEERHIPSLFRFVPPLWVAGYIALEVKG